MLVVALSLIVFLAGAYWFVFRKEKFQPGYELERTIGGYGAIRGDKRSVAAQNFGIDDSLAGVFSARILTPWDYYARVRQNNMRMAKTAQCQLACAS
jgi:hypothetical protein